MWKVPLKDFLIKIPPEAKISTIQKDFLKDLFIKFPPEAKNPFLEEIP